MYNWRPPDWMNEFKKDSDYYQCREASASAMLKAVIEWLGSDCPHGHGGFWLFAFTFIPIRHRKDCPQCMESLNKMGVK